MAQGEASSLKGKKKSAGRSKERLIFKGRRLGAKVNRKNWDAGKGVPSTGLPAQGLLGTLKAHKPLLERGESRSL